MHNHVLKFYLFILSILFSFHLNAQTGLPGILNFTKNTYGAAGRNWSATVDSSGCIYFGNTNGLLRYNGSDWELYSLPGNKMVRSVKALSDRIYVGSFCEFGYFKKDEFGNYIYTSLSDSLQNFAFRNQEIWDIISYKNKIYFRYFTGYFVYDGKNVYAKKLPYSIPYLGIVNDKIYAYIKEKGFCSFENEELETLVSNEELYNDKVIAAFSSGKNVLLLTSENGILNFNGKTCNVWKTEVNLQLKNTVANRAVMTKDSTYVIGTISDGIFAISKDGNFLWHINTLAGLKNNTILGLCCDKDNNIWAALDEGIAYIGYNSELRFVRNPGQDIGYVYDAIFKDNMLYVATNQGVYYSDNNEKIPVFKQIPGIKEQSWNLSVIDNQLFCGNNDGTFEITGKTARKITDVGGGTSMKKSIFFDQEIQIQSTYTHLVLYKKDVSGNWVFSHTIKNFTQPFRSLEIDPQGNIWASHFYTPELFKITLSPDLKSVDSVRVFSSLRTDSKNEQIHLFKFKGRIVCNDKVNFYTFDDLTDSIKPYDLLNEKLADYKDIQKSIPAGNDIYWLVRPGEFILIKIDNQDVKILQRIPFSLFHYELPDNDENVTPLSDSSFIFCMKNGVAVWNADSSPYKVKNKNHLLIERVSVFSDKETVKYLPIKSSKKISVPYKYHSLSFSVVYPSGPEKEIKYRCMLEGKDKNYSSFSLSGKKEYHKLSPGKYTFHAEAADNLGNILDSVRYDFEIKAPFYATSTAYFIYFILSLGLIVGICFFIQLYIEKSKSRIELEQRKLRQAEIEAQEKEILRLKNEKLETDLTFKSKELASSTMLTIKKNEILIDIKNELSEQKEKLGTQYPNKYYEKLIKMIDSHLDSEDDWVIFQSNFDRIHENFFRNLKLKYPDLTSTDLKFCALLRLNMTTKEIANLMNITVKGVERGRNRLRKRLEISPDTSLVDFMIGFK